THFLDGLERDLANEDNIGADIIRMVYLGGYRRVGWDKPQFFTTNFDEDGELSSKDPNMLTYLAIYHFCSGDIETTKHYFEHLETFGNQYPFTEEALNTIDRLVLLLGFSEEPLATELALRLAAIREKNYLIQMPTEKDASQGPDQKKADRLQVLRSLILQEKYSKYLESLKYGSREYLSPEDELFILQTLTRSAKEVLDFSSWESLQEYKDGKLAPILQSEYVAQMLLRPQIMRRLHYLRVKYEEGNMWMNRQQRFLFEAMWYERSNPYTRFLVEPKRRGFLGQLNAVVKEVGKSPLARPQDVDFKHLLSSPEYSLETVPVERHQITPDLFASEFIHYYCFATNQMPGDWKGDPQRIHLFQEKREKYLKAFPLLSGNFSKEYSLFYDLLMRVHEGASILSPSKFFGDFPDADKIRVHLILSLGGTEALERRLEETSRIECLQFITYGEECRREGVSPFPGISTAHQVIYNQHNREIKYIQEILKLPAPKLEEATDFNAFMRQMIQKSRTIKGMEVLQDVATLGNAYGAAKRLGMFALNFFSITTYPAKFIIKRVVFPGYVGWEERIYRGISKVLRDEIAIRAENAHVDEGSKDLSMPLAQTLIQRENFITASMRDLLEEYMKFESNLLPAKSQIPRFNVEAFEGDEALVEGFKAFNKACEDYYAREPGVKHTFTLKEGRTREEFIAALQLLKNELTENLEKEQREIVAFVNQEKISSEDEVQRTLTRLDHLKSQKWPISFGDIKKWFLTEDDAILINGSETSKQHLPMLKTRLYLYFLTQSRFNILFQKLEHTDSSDPAFESLASELLRTRTYVPEAGKPERLLKAKLIIEAETGKMLWKVQADQLDQIIEKGGSHLMNVMIMGDGKSSVVIPASDYVAADGRDKLSINVWPRSVKGQCLDMMEETAKGVYHQGVNAFTINRQRDWDRERLWALQVNVTEEDMQALLLRFIEEGLDKESAFSSDDSEYLQRIDFYKKILLLIREKGIGNIDEIHEAAREDKELNFPLGRRKTLKIEYAECLEEVLLQLVSTPEVAQYIFIKDREPKKLPESVFKERVAPEIARKLVRLKRFDIPEEDRDEIAAYLCGRTEEIPAAVSRHPLAKQIDLLRGTLTVIAPKALEKIIHKHFHIDSTDTGDETARPSDGNVNIDPGTV
ncbi:MAG: DUF3638 domain-containing protein, partial [Simkaniaceae bacterium]|nr:DUF3638 domain-containing protein [Simkaniaceae bacterium]